MTHSAGPWRVTESDNYVADPETKSFKVISADGETICDNASYYPHPVLEQDANLIAAAPEMLDALRLAIEWMEFEHIRDKLYSVVEKASK